jgi:peptidoglycan hydrolase-like protein with peptidoglycan-binding domain
MRFAGAVLIASALALPSAALVGLIVPPDVAQAQNAKAAKKKASAPKAAPVPQPGRDVYPGMPLADRVALQFDLAWSGHYNGLINGEFSDRAIAAVRAFQKNYKFKETGVLAPPERAALATLSKSSQDQVGWRMVDDPVTGAQVGLPTKQVPNTSRTSRGTRWFSAQGQVQVETFRIREPGQTLATVLEQQKLEPANRKIEVNLRRDNFFILSGTQGLKKFYVRAEVRDLEIRGLTVLWDPATEVIMDPAVVVMSSAFAPFPGSGLSALMEPPTRRKVEYGTGIIVSAAGHILTDQKLSEDCSVIEATGRGDAVRIADDSTSGLALLQLFGAFDLAPFSLTEGAADADLTLIGVADPQAQSGGRLPSLAPARLTGDRLQPTPPLGFAGAAALDAQGRFAGMVSLTTPVVASAGSTTVPMPQATLVSAATVRRFLQAQNVTIAADNSGSIAARNAVVRVICVRR